MITATEVALGQVKRLLEDNKLEDAVLRMGVQGGGCSGLSYTLGFDKDVSETDNVFEFDGVRIVVDMKSFLYLKGTELDYADDLLGGGFKFNNPNAQRSCGCGSSFTP